MKRLEGRGGELREAVGVGSRDDSQLDWPKESMHYVHPEGPWEP